MSTILPTANPRWGFYGTWARAASLDDETENTEAADAAWAVASCVLAEVLGLLPEDVVVALDSRPARHLADQVSHLWHDLEAVERELRALLARRSWRRDMFAVLTEAAS